MWFYLLDQKDRILTIRPPLSSMAIMAAFLPPFRRDDGGLSFLSPHFALKENKSVAYSRNKRLYL